MFARRLVFFLLGAALFFGGAATSRHYEVGSAWAAQSDESLPLGKLRELAEAIELIRRHYVDDVSREELMESAVRGVLDGLDPHSAYLSADELEVFQKSLSGERYGGVGIYLGERNGWIEIIAPLDGLPASRAGLQAGDLIVRIDGESTHKMSIDKAAKKMRGKVGDIVGLEVLRPSDNSRRKVELRRESIVTPSVVSGLAEPGYGYIRISRFQNQTVGDLLNSMSSLYKESNGDLRGLVVDLRNNPGGVLHASIGVASVFLPPGVTVVSDRARAREDQHFVAERKHYRGFELAPLAADIPMVILVNEGSASASEIVAGALQDHKRAVLLGARTYGKASVQSIINLRSTNGKTALKLTMARYYTPSGKNIQARGIEPDIAVSPVAPEQQRENAINRVHPLRESDLQGHLPNDEPEQTRQQQVQRAKPVTEQKETEETKDNTRPFIPVNDRQYDEAMEVLKSLAVAEKTAIGKVAH